MSLVETLNAEHQARLARFARAAETPKVKAKPPSYEIPNTPLGVPKDAPFVSPDQAWVERQKLIPLPHKPKEPWFEIVDGPRDFPVLHAAYVSIDRIQREVANHFGLSVHNMLSDRRTPDLALPRQIVFYLSRQLTKRSLPEIGRRCGGRDHTTILHGVRKIGALIKKDARLCASVEMLIHLLGGEPA
jgi:hypothetical protein